VKGPFLVVAPLSTLSNWKKEFEKWTDLQSLMYNGSDASKSIIKEYELRNSEGEFKFDVLITNFESIAGDKLIKTFEWTSMIVDEAHKVKNVKSAICKNLKQIQFKHCVLLTGTPIQNGLKELWSLLNIIDPTHFQ
jgi:chromodomain helicase DNA binding protein 8